MRPRRKWMPDGPVHEFDKRPTEETALSKDDRRFALRFIADRRWQDSTSPAYKAIPHQYTIVHWLKGDEARAEFYRFCGLIREHGYKARFGKKAVYPYLNIGDYRYWVMAPVANGQFSPNILINRARI